MRLAMTVAIAVVLGAIVWGGTLFVMAYEGGAAILIIGSVLLAVGWELSEIIMSEYRDRRR